MWTLAEVIKVENFPIIQKYVRPQIQESQRTPRSTINKCHTHTHIPKHINANFCKLKMDSKSEGSQREKTHYRRTKIRIITDFLSETMQTRKQWREIFKSLKEKSCQARIFYPVKGKYLSRIKTFSSKQLIFNKPGLQEMLKNLI